MTRMAGLHAQLGIFFFDPGQVVSGESRQFHQRLQLLAHTLLIVLGHRFESLLQVAGFHSLDAVQLRGIETKNLAFGIYSQFRITVSAASLPESGSARTRRSAIEESLTRLYFRQDSLYIT